MAVLSVRSRRGAWPPRSRALRRRLGQIDWILWGVPLGLTAVAGVLIASTQRLANYADWHQHWISAAVGDSVRMLGIDEVLYFQAQDKYVRVVTGDDEAVIRTPLKELLAGLDPDEFWQVHRGVVVRVAAIDRLRKDELGKARISLRGRGDTLPVSAAFLHRFRGM